MIGCTCSVCRSADPRNSRTRSSILVRQEETAVVIDTGPDFRFQALRARLARLDAVIITHDHADHLNGIDDLRVFTWHQALPFYSSAEVADEVRSRFPYIFRRDAPGGGIPNLLMRDADPEGVQVGNLRIVPVPIYHGCRVINGYRIGSAAYLTDCSGIPESSYKLLEDLELLVIGALRYRPHPTHFSVAQAAAAAGRIGAERTYLTHMCHDLDHAVLAEELPQGIFPAYDGLSCTFRI